LGQVVSQAELILRRGEWKRNGEGVVCASGGFDLLHPGHIRLLDQARALGRVLVVALESDATLRAASNRTSISKSRSTSRPVTPAAERAEILAALAAVDFVVELDDVPLADFLGRLAPDVLVRGRPAGISEPELQQDSALARAGCKIVDLPLEPGYSTTRLLERIRESHL
jgi:rfaE bifunctional protein nucleotidyltransferase chain/domain